MWFGLVLTSRQFGWVWIEEQKWWGGVDWLDKWWGWLGSTLPDVNTLCNHLYKKPNIRPSLPIRTRPPRCAMDWPNAPLNSSCPFLIKKRSSLLFTRRSYLLVAPIRSPAASEEQRMATGLPGATHSRLRATALGCWPCLPGAAPGCL